MNATARPRKSTNNKISTIVRQASSTVDHHHVDVPEQVCENVRRCDPLIAGPTFAPGGRLALAVALTALAAAPATGADLYWDANGVAVGVGGTGTWNTSSSTWSLGSDGVSGPYSAWNNANLDNAIFAGTAGTVTLGAPVTAHNLSFTTSGYTLTGGSLTLGGTAPTITTSAGVSATINSPISGSAGLVKAGAGTLTISNVASTYTGGTTASQGTLTFGGYQALGSGTITLGDANSGASNVSLLASFPNYASGQFIANNIVVNAAGNGTVSIGSTSFSPGSNGTIYTGTMTLNGNVTLVGGNTDRTSFYGRITGTGNITTTGSRITIDNPANDFVGNVTIAAGNLLQLDAANVLPRTTTLNIQGGGVLQFANNSHLTIDALNGPSNAGMTRVTGAAINLAVGAANGSGAYAGVIPLNVVSSFTKLGSGTQILSGANTYAGVTKISGGSLSTQLLANGGAASGIGASTSAAANLVLDGGALQYTGTGASTDRQFTLTTNGGGLDASGSDALNLTSTAAIALSGTGARTLTLSGSSTAANTLNAALGDSGGPSFLVKTGAGRWALTANNGYTGSTTISAGTLALSGTGSVASSARVIADGAFDISGVTAAGTSVTSLAGSGAVALGAKTLTITAASDTFSGVISGGGGLTLTGGVQTLTGANSYQGATAVSGGTLLVNGVQSSATGATQVATGATLGGAGTVGGNVTVASGGTLSPGSAGTTPGTLTIKGNLSLGGGSLLGVNFGQANVVGGPFNDLVNVGADLTLGGTLNVTQTAGGTFGPGIYRVISYGGALTDNGLTVTDPNYSVQTSVANQVNLVNSQGLVLSFWDGDVGPHSNSTVNGGSGTWRAVGDQNWTNSAGVFAAPFNNASFAIFQGAAGTVSVDNANGPVQASGMQFASNGYAVKGGPITLVPDGSLQSIIRVGDGTAAGAGYTATIASVLSGASQLVKTDLGTLVLTGANTYTGGTALKQGRLNVGSNSALGTGELAMDDGTTLGFAANGLTVGNAIRLTGTQDPVIDTGAFNATVAGAITGAGFLTKEGTGTLTLTAANNYTGATNVAAGTLRAGAASTFSAASAYTAAAGATLDLAGFSQTVQSVTNAGAVSLVGTVPGTTLTVTGPWVGNGGTLRVGSALGTDGSATDRLVLRGATAIASGTTGVLVTNLGGLGGQTTGNGIEIVSTENGGSIQAGAFALAAPVAAGAFQYRLDTTGSAAYLSNTVTVVPPTSPGTPTAPAAPAAAPAVVVPMYRAEVPLFAALPAQLRQADTAMLGNMHRRIGDTDVVAGGATQPPAAGQRRAWGRVISTDMEIRQEGTVSPSSDGRLNGFQAGTDLWADGRWRVGVYAGQLDGNVDVTGFARGISNLSVGYNDLRSQYLGVYGTYVSEGGFYADAVLQGARHRYTVNPVSALSVDGKGSGFLASLEVGQAFALAPGWTIEPQLQVAHRQLSLDDTVISGALVQNDSENGWLLRAGVRVKGEIATGAGMLQPYARVNVYHAGSGTDVARFIGPAAFTDISSRTGYTTTEVAVGATLQLGAATSVYGEVGQLFGSGGDQRLKSAVQGSVGLRVNW